MSEELKPCPCKTATCDDCHNPIDVRGLLKQIDDRRAEIELLKEKLELERSWRKERPKEKAIDNLVHDFVEATGVDDNHASLGFFVNWCHLWSWQLKQYGKLRVEDIGLSTRVSNALRHAHIATVAKLVTQTPDFILSYNGMGKHGLAEIRQKLKDLKLGLRSDHMD